MESKYCDNLLLNKKFKYYTFEDKFNIISNSKKYKLIFNKKYLEFNLLNNESYINEIEKKNVESINKKLCKLNYIHNNKFYFYYDNKRNTITLDKYNKDVTKNCIDLRNGNIRKCHENKSNKLNFNESEAFKLIQEKIRKSNKNEENKTNLINDELHNIITENFDSKTNNIYNEFVNKINNHKQEINDLDDIISYLNILKLYNKKVIYNDNEQIKLNKNLINKTNELDKYNKSFNDFKQDILDVLKNKTNMENLDKYNKSYSDLKENILNVFNKK